MFAIGSFIGFEATAIYGEETKNPRRTVPIATYVAVITIGVLYAVASWAIVLAFGSDNVQAVALENTADPTFIATTEYLGSVTSDVMMVMLVTSLFAALLAFHNAISRYSHALSRSGFAPRGLSAVHARHGSPHVGSLVQTASAFILVGIFALAGADPVLELFTWMAGVATVAMLVVMVLTSIAIVIFFARSDVDNRLWHTKIAPALGGLGLCAITALVIANFTTLIGGSQVLANVFLAIIAATFIVASVVGHFVIRSRDRDGELTPTAP